MNKDLIEKLSQITNEERQILSGEPLKRENYTNKNQFEIEGNKMMEDMLVSVRKHTRFCDFPKHKHDYIEMMYVVEGSIDHVIDNKDVCLNKGEILLLNQHSWHGIKKAEENDIAINFIMQPSFLDVVYSMIGTDSIIAKFLVDILRQDITKDEYLIFRVGDIPQIQHLVEIMIESLYEKKDEFYKENQITMGLLFMYLTRHLDKVTKGSIKKFDELLVETCLDYISANYQTATLQEISDKLKQPNYVLSRLIKQQTGKTFKELLQSRRFYKALDLLMETDLSVDDIILSVGYEGHSYFFKRFKQKYDMTPNQYRNKMKNSSLTS